MADGVPHEFVAAAQAADELWFHVAEFDRTLLMKTTTWWPAFPIEKYRCTAALARFHGLPGGLDKLCHILKVPMEEAKDAAGKPLIMLFCVPKDDGTYNDWKSHPLEWLEFLKYGGSDITSMRAVYYKLPKWNSTPRMWSLWALDQRMNDRGVAFDTQFAAEAVALTDAAKRALAERTKELTYDEILEHSSVESTTQRNRLIAYCAAYGVTLPDLTADTVERRLEDESLPEGIKELLRIRQQASKASTAKYARVGNMQIEGRLRGLLLFCGAARTGRWAGRVFQPHNLPRPKHEQHDIDTFIALTRIGAGDIFNPAETMGLAASSLRGLIVAPSGRKLLWADLAGIESRKMAWLAGEEWKLEAFRDYDMGVGPDLYKSSIARSFGKDLDWFDWDDAVAQWRQCGKVQELALQYYGGVGAYCSLADTYHLNLDAMAAAAWSTLPYDVKAQATEAWHKAVKRNRIYGLEQRTWIVCQSLVLLWRAAHPAIVKFWYALENAVFAVIRSPDCAINVGRVTVDRRGSWVRIRLPSGRYLCYPAVHQDDRELSFIGINPYTRQWHRISTYSGKLAENIVQASATDILFDGLMAAADEGYNPILTVHDELLCEPPDSAEFTPERLSEIMCTSSFWAEGLPMTAKGIMGYRYRK
jgi:DNA polymerase